MLDFTVNNCLKNSQHQTADSFEKCLENMTTDHKSVEKLSISSSPIRKPALTEDMDLEFPGKYNTP